MPRIIYDPKTRAAILAAAKGKKLKDAHAAAKVAGYKGGMQALYVMLRNSGVKRRRRRKSNRPAMPQRGAPKAVSAGAGSIEAAIQRLVKERVQMTISEAINILERVVN